MIGTALRAGVRSATRRPGLVALLWGWNLLLALAATLPFHAWLASVSDVSPESDVLLDGLDIGVFTHLVANNPGALSTFFTGVAAVVMLSVLSGAFLSGGLLEVAMNDGDGRSLLHRFFRGAGHFFGRFLRLLVIAVITLAMAVALLGAALTAATRPIADGASEPAAILASLSVAAIIALVAGFFLLSLDYARVITVLTDGRGMLRAWFRGIRFVARHLLGTAFIGVIAAVAVASTLAATACYDLSFSARSWALILGAVVLQQAMLLVRTAVRVGQVSAQARYCHGLSMVLDGPLRNVPVPDEGFPGAAEPHAAPLDTSVPPPDEIDRTRGER